MKMFLFNRKQKVKRWLADKDFIEAKMTEQINAAAKLFFSVPLKKRLPSTYFFAAIPQPRGSGYLLFKIVTEQVQSDRVQYTCIEAAYDELKSYHYIKDDRPQDRTAAEMLQMALDGTRWSVGTAYDAGTGSTNFYYISSLEAIQKIADLFKLEVMFSISLDPNSHQIVRRLVNLYAQQGRRTGKRFEYGSNLLSVEREESSENLITALIGRGKGEEKYHTVDGKPAEEDQTPDGYGRRINFADVVWSTDNGNPVNKPAGQEYVEDPDATAAYGFDDGKPRIGIEIFEDITDPGELLQATWSALQTLKRPKVSFKANTLDVGDLGLGDTVALIRHDIKIEYFTRVYKVEHNLLNEKQNTIELGDDFNSQSITSAINSIASAVKQTNQTANYASVSANGKNTNNYGKDKPTLAVEGDLWYKDLGNGEVDLYQYHDGNWILITSTRDFHNVQKQVEKAQSELDTAKNDIVANKQKADTDIENLNKSIEDNKRTADESLQKLNDSVANLKGQYDNNIVPDLNKAATDAADALQKYIEAQKSIADLTKQAQQQGKDIADVTSTVNGLNINYANLAGDVSSTKADVKGLQTTIGTANGDIAQLKLDAQSLKTMLAGKVDDSVYQNFVTLTNRALAAKLTASDLAGYAKTVDVQATANGLQLNIDSVNGRLNNLKIGGRNYLRNSDKFTSGYMQDLGTMPEGVLNQLAGKTITVSCDVEWSNYVQSSEKQNRLGFEIAVTRSDGKSQWFGAWEYPSTANGKKRIFTTFDLPAGVTFNVANNGQNGYVIIDGTGKVGHAKVEIGNRATDWSPAPEDFTNDIMQLSARITTNSQQFSSYYTKSETDSKADFAKNDAVNAIKSDGNWQGLNNILTNSGFLQTADGFLQKVQQTTIPMFSGGGVNLVKDTSESEISGKAYDIKDYYFSEPLEPNTKYTISIDAKVDQEALNHQQFIFVDPYTANWSWGAQMSCISASLEYQHYRYTFITPDASQKVTNISVYLAHPDGATNGDRDNLSGTGYFKKLKVERGEIDTPYSHAPSDNASQIAFSELSQSLEGLRSTVESNYGSLQSQISQSSSSIRTELTDKIKGVDNKTTSTANSLNSVIGRVGSLENLTNFQVINNAINANDYTKTGNYFIQSTSNTNVPATNWCYLKVEKVNDGRIVQTWQADSDPTLRYVRTKFGDSWTQWQRSASYSEYSELNRTVQGLQSIVSNNHGELQSQISQTAKTIRQEVSDKTNGLQTQITQQSNNFNVSLNALRNETAWQKVTTAIDANNYTTTGNYWIQAAPNSNTPDGSAWAYLEVVAEPAVERIKQTWQRDNNANEAYTRLKTGNTWTAWQKTVTAGNIMAQINMSAGTTLIQNDKIYMDASSTVFSGKAFIPSAAITDLSADKITTGTLNAGNVNIINMNADNITAGTIKGTNLSIGLNSGEVEFQHGRIHNLGNTVDIDLDKNYISTADFGTRVLLKNGELQLTEPSVYDTNNDSWYFKLNNWPDGNNYHTALLSGRHAITLSTGDGITNTGAWASSMGTIDFRGVSISENSPTVVGGGPSGMMLKAGTEMSIKHNIMDPNDGGVIMTGSPYILIGTAVSGWNGNRIIIDGEYVHIPSTERHTTGESPNVYVAPDGALVRSTSASKYKTDIQRSHSLDYGERLLSLPTATWIDKAESRRYASGESDMKPVTHFGMIAEDLAAAGLEMLVSRGQDGELEGIQYDRIAPALLPVIKKLQDRIKKMEERLNG